MINSFELTIEELLDGNGIEYTKTEGDLVVNSADNYPTGINIQSSDYSYGYQYRVANDETTTISTTVPTAANSTTVLAVPNQNTVVTNEVAGIGGKNNTGGIVVFTILVIATIATFFSPVVQTKKQK